jgi:hypothetical protein
MEMESSTLRLMKRMAVLLPLLALPFAPAMGKEGATLLLSIVVQDAAPQ